MTDPLVRVDQLDSIAPVAFADVRWYLTEPDQGRVEYETGHIPGAVYVDLDDHLSAASGPGRHPLPTREAFAQNMSDLGFGTDDLVIAYDDRGGAVAARLWWMLRDIGHDAVRVLDGGIQAWIEAGRPLEPGISVRPPADMRLGESLTRQLDRVALKERLGQVTLLDARAPERYRGDEEPVDPVAGHIPTALSADMAENLDETLRFRSPEELRHRYRALGVTEERDTVVYCGSGVNACHHALAMHLAGLPDPILYPGSWSDWSSSGSEVATGPEPGTA